MEERGNVTFSFLITLIPLTAFLISSFICSDKLSLVYINIALDIALDVSEYFFCLTACY